MELILNREQIRSYDRLATGLCKIPSLLLMENAGRGAADGIENLAAAQGKTEIGIICGTGNNGGDGFVVARHLIARGFRPKVFLAGNAEKIAGDARIQWDALLCCGVAPQVPSVIEVTRCGIIVDALFGTGLSRDILGEDAAIIDAVNAAPALRIALDIPSGLDADTGQVLGRAVKAHHTFTFAYAKQGLYTPQGKIYAGEIHVVNLGVADETILAQTGHAAGLIRAPDMRGLLVARDAATYKHRAGDILIVAGSPGKTGAAKLVAEAALRSGAGLATICTWQDSLTAFEKEIKEVMLAPLDRKAVAASLEKALPKRTSIVAGPGFGLGEESREAIGYLLQNSAIPLVLDADAITLCAQNLPQLKNCTTPKILTPHSGELARILSTTSAAIEADRFGSARRAAEMTGAVIVLKGAHTLIAEPAGRLRVSAEANPALATAGSGDVLGGIIAAFAGALAPFEAAVIAVFTHAAAANLWSSRTRSDRGMLAGDISALIPEVLGQML